MSEQKRLDRPDGEKMTDWIYDALKEIEIEEQIRLSDRAFIADHLAPKILALFPDEEDELRVVGLIKKQERERIMTEIQKHSFKDKGRVYIVEIGDLLVEPDEYKDRPWWQALKEV